MILRIDLLPGYVILAIVMLLCFWGITILRNYCRLRQIKPGANVFYYPRHNDGHYQGCIINVNEEDRSTVDLQLNHKWENEQWIKLDILFKVSKIPLDEIDIIEENAMDLPDS